MNSQDMITKILRAVSVKDIFPDLTNWKTEYKRIIKLIHPDICSLDGCKDASAKLDSFKHELESGKTHKDEVGTIKYTLTTLTIKGDKAMLQTSLNNYNLLMSLNGESSDHFKKYLPASACMNSESELVFILRERSIPISSLGTMSQDHVNWILSRMMEFSGWINQVGYCHAGINPDSIYVTPENHGMCCVSFYHMAKLNSTLKTVSGKYLNFYPSSVFKEKKAAPGIDVELCKRTAVYLLGDKSGSGVVLRKTHNTHMIDFLHKQHHDPIKAYSEYRSLLKKHFDPKKFHVLNV